MSIRTEMKEGRLYLDGGMGTLLQERGLEPGELPERWNRTHRAEVVAIHQAYYDAGSHIVCTNTFGANGLKYDGAELESIIESAVENVREAARRSTAPQQKYAALDVGPLGRLLQPYGDLPFETAVELFAETIRIGVRCGVDLILIETMSDSLETKAALLAAKENSDLPVLVSNAYGEDGKLMTGATPAAMAAMLEGLGADAIGVNCSLGPKQLMGAVRELLACASVPVLAKPNAGLPVQQDGKTVFSVGADEFAAEMAEMARMGVRLLGGCCGTTPEHIRKMTAATRDCPATPLCPKNRTVISSYTHAVEIGETPVLIGERINPTGKKRFKQALLENDLNYILREGLSEQEHGAQILDVNVGLPGIDEPAMLTRVVTELQAVLDLPLQLDTSDGAALEQAMRIYNGKPMVNSVNGKEASMRTVFPLVKKYGGVVVALTLDENGIPETAEERVAIARKIRRTAAEYGIAPKDIVFDTLCMSVSADSRSALTTLRALRTIHDELQQHTVLGVSNISFGLPQRETVNAGFFALALENGLSAAIMNPYSVEMQKTYRTFLLLHGLDPNCAGYIAFAETLPAPAAPGQPAVPAAQAESGATELQHAIIKGLKEPAAQLCAQLLQHTAPLDVVNTQIIPALDAVGRGFENKTVYLPQLLMSAEAAQHAFEQIKTAMLQSGEAQLKKAKFVLATVKGDIHDIGKNIVKVLLENYGFPVIDLGKDVAPETVVETVVRERAPLCGLSALMTTTVPAMAETIRQLRAAAPSSRIVVGGAVLTADYARRIGADRYAKDAMETVRYAEEIDRILR